MNSRWYIFWMVWFVTGLSALDARAVDTTYLPILSQRDQRAVVQVLDLVENTTGTGFVIGTDALGRPLVITNKHTIDGGLVEIKLLGSKRLQDVEILAICPIRDLALLRLQTKQQLPSLTLASRSYFVAAETPVLVVGASDDRLLQHTGTFDDATEFNHDSADAVYTAVYAHTPSGFSGGPVLTVDISTLSTVVIGVSAKATAIRSFGPWISEVHSFLDENLSVSGPIAFSGTGTSKPHHDQPEEEDLFAGMFGDEPSKVTPQSPLRPGQLGKRQLPPNLTTTPVGIGTSVVVTHGHASLAISTGEPGLLFFTNEHGQQQVFWTSPAESEVTQ